MYATTDHNNNITMLNNMHPYDYTATVHPSEFCSNVANTWKNNNNMQLYHSAVESDIAFWYDLTINYIIMWNP